MFSNNILSANSHYYQTNFIKPLFKYFCVIQVKLAVSALLAHLDDQSSKKARKDELFKKDDDLWLLLGFRKIPQVNLKPKKM